MAQIVPVARPRMTRRELATFIDRKYSEALACPLLVVGIRGYYKNTLGERGKNDFGLYDDAIFIRTAYSLCSFNANTDPITALPGKAVVCPGFYKAHTFGLHRGKYLALRQTAGPITVHRTYPDGTEKTESGYFGINIHRGGRTTTGSEGCQTIYYPQWESFISMAVDAAKTIAGTKWKTYTVPYVLLEN